MPTKGRLKQGDYSGGHHMGGKNHNRLLLLFSSLSLGYIFCSCTFSQAHRNVIFIETHFHFISLKYKIVAHK
jgi:hypothetical protein